MVPTGTAARALRAAGIAVLVANLLGVTVYAFAAHTWSGHGGAGLASSVILAGAYGVVGVLIASRRPDVPIGWLLLFCGALWSVGLWNVWPQHIVDTGGRLTGFAAVVADDQWLPWPIVAVPAIQLPLLLLPDGRLRSRRWRPVAMTAIAAMVVATLSLMLMPGQTDSFPQVHHPGIPGSRAVLSATLVVAAVILVAVAVFGLVGLVREYRRARDLERQQLRWLAAGGLGAVLALATGAVTSQAGWGTIVSSLGLASIPASIGIAVLRYRLYDLGRLVSRTVTYLLLTTVLVAVYVGIAAVAGLVTGGSNAGVAAGTLVAAALFQPLRRRVQAIVDRRFNRTRYDVTRIVDGFAGRLRSAVSTEAVIVDLIDVTGRALQPASVSVWRP
ncbi:MAG TPA: hypothetical protein VFJ17_09690 [Mycobacteriales bacterium]|jgi:hypothetical protein|nr:hypothetical protein [Mycobacteriales bacterium]